MRQMFIAALLIATAGPALAQTPVMNARVDKLEKEMRAVQRKVFPGGAQAIVEPEITSPTAPVDDFGQPASTPIADLTARVSSMEQELSRLTGQVEQNQNRLKQLEDQLAKFRGDAEFRLNALEGNGGAPAAAAPGTAPPFVAAPPPAAPPAPAGPAPAAGPSSGDAAEDAYMAGYRLWEAKKYGEAETALKAFVAKYPQHRRASFAQNLLGRTLLDANKPAAAAAAFLANYNKNPRGERAPDSLYYLGQSLMKLSPPQPAKACDAYAELLREYGSSIAQPLRDRITRGQADAKCKA